MNTYEAPVATPATTPKSAVSPGKARRVSRDDQGDAKRREACDRWARSLKDIRSKMRSGYSAKQGERMRDREDKLKANQRASRCG